MKFFSRISSLPKRNRGPFSWRSRRLRICLTALFAALAVVVSAVLIVSGTAAARAWDASEVFLKQEGAKTCTLTAATMMLRRRAIIDNDQNWRSITEGDVKKVAWAGSAGLMFDFTYKGMRVFCPDVFLTDLTAKKGQILNLLKNHPEGIVFYNTYEPHAVLLADYDASTDTFYCADPALGNGRIKLTSSTLPGGTQDGIIGKVRQYWYITNRSGGDVPAYPTPPPGYTDVTDAFASSSVRKTIYLKAINGKYAQNSQPVGNTNVLFLSSGKGVAEAFTVCAAGGDICLRSDANGKFLKANGAAAASASVAGDTVTNESVFRIYRNNSNGLYYLRLKSNEYYMAANFNSPYSDLFLGTTSPPGNWEPFGIEVKPAYSASASLPNGYYAIQHKSSKKYVSANGSADASPAILYEDGNGSTVPGIAQDQQLKFERQSDGTYIITARHTGKALEVLNLDHSNRAKIIQWPKNGSDQQRWYVIDMGGGYYKLVNRYSGSCLDIYGNGSANSTPVHQCIDNGTDAQRFSLIRQDFTITFDANGGSGAPPPQTYWRDVPFTLSTVMPTRSGYTFLGWANNKNATQAQLQPGTRGTGGTDGTCYAVWKSNVVCTVTYDANGGVGAPGKQTVEKGKDLVLSTTKPTRSGYTFLGWSLFKTSSAPSTQPGGTLCSITFDITLYAVWKSNSVCTVTYDANGGAGALGKQTVEKGKNLVLSTAKPTRGGYTFLGWALTKSASTPVCQPGNTISISNDITLYAVWKANTIVYTVTYDANGGAGAPGKQTVEKGKNLVLSTTKPTRGGYAFEGWALTKSASKAVCQPGSTISISNDITLCAVWGWKDVTSQFVGKRIAMQSKQWGNKYLSAWQSEYGAPIYARVAGYSNPSANAWETFTVSAMTADGYIGFLASNGKYISVNADNGNEHTVTASGASRGNWECFRIMQYGSDYAIQVRAEGKYSYKGSYLTVSNLANNPLRANRNLKTPQAWECLAIKIV